MGAELEVAAAMVQRSVRGGDLGGWKPWQLEAEGGWERDALSWAKSLGFRVTRRLRSNQSKESARNSNTANSGTRPNEYNVRGYAVLPVVDIRSLGLLCHAVGHQY